MKNQWSRGLALGLALTVTGGLAISCGSTAGTTAPGATTTAAATSNKLTLAIQQNAFITDYKDNYLTKMIEADLGVDLEFYMLPQATQIGRASCRERV